MNDEIKSIKLRPDLGKRQRPFFSIRRRFDPDGEKKLRDERRKLVRENAKARLKFMLVVIVLFLVLAPIVTGLLIAYQDWKSEGIFSNPFLNFLF